MDQPRPLSRSLLAVVVPVAALAGAFPALAETAYQTPPQALVDIVDAPLTPDVMIAPGGDLLLLLEPRSLPSIAELAAPELRLAGLRFNPRTDGPSRSWPAVAMNLVEVGSGAERPVSGLPQAPRIDAPSFSPDGAHVAFAHTDVERGVIELWVLQVAEGEARRVLERPLHRVVRRPLAWVDDHTLMVTLVPADRGPAPPPPRVPAGPVIRQNLGETSPARTYQDLLENAHDEALFAHHLRSQLALVDLDGEVTPIGDPALVWSYEPSPDGRYAVVETLHRPFSYLVPASRFPRRIEIVDRAGDRVRLIADLPLQEGVPTTFGSVPTGPRSVTWRGDAGATLAWVEALDGGDAGVEAEERDRLFLLPAPFAGEPRPWIKLAHRLSSVYWGRDDLALVASWWWKTRNVRLLRASPGAPEQAPETLVDRSWEDRYNDPGTPVTVANAGGRQVLLADGDAIYMIGEGASPEGNRPFLDLFDLRSKTTRRLFRSAAPYYERPILPLDAAAAQLLTRRESVDEPPNYFLRPLAGGEPRQLTFFPHPTPQLKGIRKELLRYRRDDGVELTATLYLPPGYSPEQGPLPTLLWAYPREYKSAAAAGQVDDSPYRFDRIGWWSPLVWLTQGYAVLDDPKMPIVGEGDEEPNDTFRRQLVASAKAAVDEVVRRGVAKPGHIAIAGHSYGAFMTANLLAHSDLFAAGIARSGAYNRTLTPFGFQSEERTFWQAPEVYFAMSPFMHVDKIDEPILLIHGEADNNSGTFPIQSERFYNALKGHGAIARLVMLPYESHGYRARESNLHVLWETYNWLETYVRKDLSTGRPPQVEADAVRGEER
ncbi:MAG: S9 family peptidase [Acidobacteria bacterium]|nr:MAG: S9 family peptidase [Acidobacteriota bacterium]